MPARKVRDANRWVDERLGSQRFTANALNHIFPDHWSFMLGEMAMYCFVVLVLSGVYLTFFFVPSSASVVYHGSYPPLHGQTVSAAYASVVNIDLVVRAGNFFRQMHHWAADLFVASITCHALRIFFTGAFRKPRDINWHVGLTMLLLALAMGFTGYSLPGDLLSGLGLRIAYTVVQSIPVFGNWIAYLFFGGQFPSPDITHRLYLLHIMILPGLLSALIGVHLALIWRQKHTQFPARGRTEKRLVGSQLWPTYAFRSVALLCGVVAVISLLAGLVQINPIWEYGFYTPDRGTIFAQPDWYVGFLEGSLRLFPAWRLHLWGYTVSEVFWPGALFPGVYFGILYLWPTLERWVTKDDRVHNLLDRPRDRPVRVGFGVAGVTLMAVLVIAGGQDYFAHIFRSVLPPITLGLRGIAIVAPPLFGVIAWKIAKDLRRAGWVPETEPPKGSNDEGATPPTQRYLPPAVRYRRRRHREEVPR